MTSWYPPGKVPPLKSEEMARDLVGLPQVLRQLAEQQLEWQPLAVALLAGEHAAKLPTGKQLQQALGIPASRFRRWLAALYAAYLHLLETDADALDCQRVEHRLVLRGERASQTFSCRLPITPRVGEHLEVPFLRAVTGESSYYVTHIVHDFTDGRYVLFIYLDIGYYNAYQHQMRQRARYDEVMSLEVAVHAPGFVVDDFLRERYPPPPASSQAQQMLAQAEARYGRRSRFSRRR